jgi:signal transduction histidine kinase/DNA-binding response OmpR family regulator
MHISTIIYFLKKYPLPCINNTIALKSFPLLLLLFFPLVVGAQLQGKAWGDSLLLELPKAKEDSNKVNILTKLTYFMGDNDPDAAVRYGQQALQLARSLSWEKGIAQANHVISLAWYAKSELDSTMKYATTAQKSFEALHDKRGVAISLGTISYVWQQRSDFAKAIAVLLQLQAIAESMGDEKLLEACYGGLGNSYFELKDYQLSLSYHQKALEKSQALNDKFGVSGCLSNMGNIYSLLGNNKKALEYLVRAVGIDEESGEMRAAATHRCNIGNVYLTQKSYADAIGQASKVLQIGTDISDPEAISRSLLLLGSAHLGIAEDVTGKLPGGISRDKKINVNKALGYLQQSIVKAKETGDLVLMADVYEALSGAYLLSGRPADAYDNYVERTKLKDSIFSSDNKLKIAALETKRETELKEKQIEINKVQAKEKQNEQLFFVVGIALLLAIVFTVVRNYNRQKRTNAQLETSNKKLAEEKLRSDSLAADLTESIIHKDELTRQLERSAAMKSKFFANISHELRTPVTLLTGMLELVQDGNAAGGNHGKLKVAYDSSRKLQNMVEEILDLSKLEIGKSTLNIRIREIAPLLKRMVYAFETLIEKEQLALEYNTISLDGRCIAIDENKFEKIINNLIYNAIKFNTKGGWLKVTAASSADGMNAIIHVNNSGIGISMEDVPHIFERFYQGDTSMAKAQGAGIGLSLVKEFTELMGGTVAVSSDPVAGTTFTLTFPFAQYQKEEEPAPDEVLIASPEGWEQLWGKQTILLVEDNAEMRYYLKEVLGDKVTLAEAGNGKEALQWLENNTPDLIISDIMMPEMDGREFISRLKGQDAYKKIPVITLTALADKESQVDMLRLGIDDYIVKPFNASELRVRVFNLLSNMQERRQFALQPSEPGDIPAESTEADVFRNKIKELVLSKIKHINVSVFDLAYELAMSERQLYRTAKSLTGCTPAQLIKEIRLQKAYELLLSGDIYKVEDVANRVGFETPAYFSKQFLERFGKRPVEFL